MAINAVTVAQDVLDHLNDLKCHTRLYIKSNRVPFNEDSDLTDEAIFHTLSNNCEVCALGACFLSLFHLTGKLNNTLIIEKTIKHARLFAFLEFLKDDLLTVFSENELCLIEISYEHAQFTTNNWHTTLSDQEIDQALHFCDHINNFKKRLHLIMQNVITNNGHFIPGA